ncbi:NAD-dependent epimerase/dehydratase family protein [soil metagenome]
MTTGATRRELRLASDHDRAGSVLITGGAGFIGTNLAHRLLSAGTRVTVLDNLSRRGVERNLSWLEAAHGDLLRIEIADVRDSAAMQRAVANARQVVHLAAQVAVTTSIADPSHDFDVNARGTLNVLSALNSLSDPPPLLFTSTNKVYGTLGELALRNDGRRYSPVDEHIRQHGIDESQQLDFQSPYACSKGAADQYVLDYARTFGLRAAVFRMSCVYGPHQVGTEDQGWVAHFLTRALRGDAITVFGDGHQVRDVLFIDDLVDAVQLAFENMGAVSGRAFNLGGGPDNTTSLLELIDAIAEFEPRVEVNFVDWRPGDQRYYVSDTARFSELTGWRPRVSVADGVRRLHDWLVAAGVPTRPVPASAEASWLPVLSPPLAATGER